MRSQKLTITFFIVWAGLSSCQVRDNLPTATLDIEPTDPVVEVDVPAIENLPLADTLVICMGQEPSTLYLYGGQTTAAKNIHQAIYDGPYDLLSFAFQPTILEKLPHLGDGDANLEKISASTGDMVVDETGALVELTPGMSVRPSGCLTGDCFTEYSSGDFEMDQMAVTFTLLPGLKWSDGAPLTAFDSVFSFSVAAHQDTPTSKFITSRTDSYEALDDRTVIWNGVPGFLDQTYYLNFFAPLPQHVFGEFTPLEMLQEEQSTRMPLGWGPFVIEQWLPGESMTLRKNPNYFRANEGLPKFETLVFRFMGINANDNLAALLTWECDVLDQTTLLDDQIELLLELQGAGQLNTIFMPSKFWEHIDFGIHPASYDDGYTLTEGDRPDFFRDTRARRAIALCLDRQAVVDDVLFGQATVLSSFIHESHPLSAFSLDAIIYDRESGIELLEEIGWRDEDGDGIRESYEINGIEDGTPFSIRYSTTTAPQRVMAAEIIAENLLGCGIGVSIVQYEFDEFFDYSESGPVAGRNFDLAQFAYRSDIQPTCEQWLSDKIPGDPIFNIGDIPWLRDGLIGLKSLDERAFIGWDIWNHSGYVNPEYDEVCHQAKNALSGENAYHDSYLMAQEMIMKDLPMIPLYWRNKVSVTRPDMCNFDFGQNAVSELWNLEMIAYGPLCE